MDKPLVSVVMPAYGGTDTIVCAIDSALRQDVHLEVIVVNDCSPNDLDAVMSKYSNHPSVRYVHNDKNMGVAKSRNRAVAMAQGEYIAFLDADDVWMPEKLKKQIKRLDETGYVLCCTARELIDSRGESMGRILPVKHRISYSDLLRHNSIACSSVLIRTDVAKEFPMHHDDSHEDYIMWLEVLQKYQYAAGINEPLLQYRVGDTGKSGSKLSSARMTFLTYRYMGFSFAKSVACFLSYAAHGVWKHVLSRGYCDEA